MVVVVVQYSGIVVVVAFGIHSGSGMYSVNG